VGRRPVNAELVCELVRAHYDGDSQRFTVLAGQLAAAEELAGSAEVADRLRALLPGDEVATNSVYDPVRADKLIAGIVNDAGDLVSGLDLTAIGEDGHATANLLWKIAAGYLRRRNDEKFFEGDTGEGDKENGEQ
jgi:hypothetical protein